VRTADPHFEREMEQTFIGWNEYAGKSLPNNKKTKKDKRMIQKK